eukprot:TRINITY_DN121095_c2_g1_i1.p7 TRINITY_DN121095_c2_g1~~TRINITY_DN121095_c2_g1_i1.p7  ORF type:complete len:115 (-),score=5.16 TRINITY_DN121095_c2_g1_i1:2163-2507(-)
MPLLTLTTVTLCIAVFGSTSALSCNKKLLSESSQCPFNGSYAIRPEETLAFTIPSSGQKISPGTVCEWELRNTNEVFLKFRVRRYTVFCLLLPLNRIKIPQNAKLEALIIQILS